LTPTNSTLRDETQHEHHDEHLATAAILDPCNALGEDKLEALIERFSKRMVVVQLTNRECRLCGDDADTFSLLMCERLCEECFYEHPDAKMCSLEFAQVRLMSSYPYMFYAGVLALCCTQQVYNERGRNKSINYY
jgi:hypothetical protein